MDRVTYSPCSAADRTASTAGWPVRATIKSRSATTLVAAALQPRALRLSSHGERLQPISHELTIGWHRLVRL